MWSLVVAIFLSFNVWSAETTRQCAHFQKDIDYWQEQYSILLKEKKEIEKELSIFHERELKKPIKLPKARKDDSSVTVDEPDFIDLYY
jgi:hypothetical protein